MVVDVAEGRFGEAPVPMVPMSIRAEDEEEGGQTMPEAFMVSLCGCFATITVLHTVRSRKKSIEF